VGLGLVLIWWFVVFCDDCGRRWEGWGEERRTEG